MSHTVHFQRRSFAVAAASAWAPRLIALALACNLAGCAAATVHTSYAPGFSRARRHISTFGIKRDGLMSRAAWAVLGPNASVPFEATSCEVAYSENVLDKLPALAKAVDDYVNANGVTDELLERLAPAALGDTIMLVTVTGHPQASGSSFGPSAVPPGASGARGGGRGGGGGGGGRRGGRSEEPSRTDSSAETFQVTASLYSPHEHHSVAQIELSDSDPDVDKALREFSARLETELPGGSCSGWDWSKLVDDAGIRKLIDAADP